MFAVDFSILTVALPKIQADLGFGIDSLQWVVTSFALTAAGFTLLSGRISAYSAARSSSLSAWSC